MESSMTSTAAQIIITVIPIVGIVIGGIVVFFYLLWHHHEVKLQIKMGTYNPQKFDLKTFSLLAGILLTGTGLIMTLFFAIIDGLSYTLLGGLIPATIGIGLIIFYKVNPWFSDRNGE